MPFEIVGGAVVIVAGIGAWMKWAGRPVVFAYRLGRQAERINRRIRAEREAQ